MTNCHRLKWAAADGKQRLVQPVPSPTAEPIKLWLGQVGRIPDEERHIIKALPDGMIVKSNAILTLQEYLEDYGDAELRELGEGVIARELATIPNPKARSKAEEFLARIRGGERDLRFQPPQLVTNCHQLGPKDANGIKHSMPPKPGNPIQLSRTITFDC